MLTYQLLGDLVVIPKKVFFTVSIDATGMQVGMFSHVVPLVPLPLVSTATSYILIKHSYCEN